MRRTNNTCRKCATPTTGLTLCNDCATALKIELGDVPELLAQLDITRTRQDQLTDPYDHGHHGGETPLPFRPHIAEVLWVLHNTLTAWAGDHGANQKWSIPTTAAWLTAHLNEIQRADHAAQLADEITQAIRQARRAIDRPGDPRMFLGPCTRTTPTGTCCTEIYGLPWQQTTTCPTCKTEYNITNRQDWMLTQAQEHLGSAVEIAGFLRILGIHCTPSMIRNYAARGRLIPAPDTHPPLYRIRDVITALKNKYVQTKRRNAS